MALPAPAAVPPTMLFDAVSMAMPSSVFPSAASPAASVPMEFPWMTLPVAVLVVMLIPAVFAAITLRAAAAVPPIVLLAVRRSIPGPPLPSAALPAAFVPIRFPRMVLLPALAPLSLIPPLAFAETTFPAPATLPPIVFPGPRTSIPTSLFARAAAPAALVPM